MDLRPVVLGKAHIGQGVTLGLVHQGSQLGHLGAELIGHLPPLQAGGFGIFLDEGGADKRRDNAAALLAGMH